MTDKIRAYLQAGEVLEQRATAGPWKAHPGYEVWLAAPSLGYPKSVVAETVEGEGASDEDAAFIADARTRLPLYRKALEAVLNLMEERWWDTPSRDAVFGTIDAVFADDATLAP